MEQDPSTNNTPRPPYGLGYVIPDNALAAWGARLIVKQDGWVDFVPDRQGADGAQEHKDRLFQLLGAQFPVSELKDVISALLQSGWMQTRAKEDFVLHIDDDLIVVANTNASAGYCYVTAWTVGSQP